MHMEYAPRMLIIIFRNRSLKTTRFMINLYPIHRKWVERKWSWNKLKDKQRQILMKIVSKLIPFLLFWVNGTFSLIHIQMLFIQIMLNFEQTLRKS